MELLTEEKNKKIKDTAEDESGHKKQALWTNSWVSKTFVSEFQLLQLGHFLKGLLTSFHEPFRDSGCLEEFG